MTLLRGRVLWPLGPRSAVFVEDGVVGPDLPAPRTAEPGDPDPEDGLIVPAFADWHFHWVQRGIAVAGGRPLLRWLRETAWPAERRFADAETCRREAAAAVGELAAVGTLEGVAYGSPHAASADAFLAAAPAAFACGPAVMTAGDPPDLVRPVEAWLDDLARLHATHGRRVVVSPRFALSVGERDLRAVAEFARERRLLVQTHLSENQEEVEEVRRRFPRARDYLDVYEAAGLLGPGTLLAHAIHVSDDELRRIAASGAVVVHCPSSNRALGSGRMPLERLRTAGVPWVLGSDVGAGPSLCMLDVAAEAVDAHRGPRDRDRTDLRAARRSDGEASQAGRLSLAEAFHRSTLSRAALTSVGDVPPGLRPGALVLPLPAGIDPGEREPRAWLEALFAERRERRPFAVRRAVPWPVSSAG